MNDRGYAHMIVKSACRIVGYMVVGHLAFSGFIFCIDAFVPKSRPVPLFGVFVEFLIGIILIVVALLIVWIARRINSSAKGSSDRSCHA